MRIEKLKYRDANILIGIVDEDVDELKHQLKNFNIYDAQYQEIHLLKRQKEFLATRILLNQLLKKDVQVAYNKEGKPYIKNKNSQISITHSKNYMAVIADKNHKVGIDIELRTKKIINIAPKFLSDTEQRDFQDDISKIEIAWCAKEALYKIIGIKAVDFAKSFEILPFVLNETGDIFVLYTSGSRIYSLRYHQNDVYTLVYVTDKKLNL